MFKEKVSKVSIEESQSGVHVRERSPFDKLYNDGMIVRNGVSVGGGGDVVVVVGGGDSNNNTCNLETTFQLDEDTESMQPREKALKIDTGGLDDSSQSIVMLRAKHKLQQKSKRKQRMSQSLSQPKFADHYRYTGDSFLGCGSYGSVYTCSSLKGSTDLTKCKSPNKVDQRGHGQGQAGGRSKSSCMNRMSDKSKRRGSNRMSDIMSSSTSEDYYLEEEEVYEEEEEEDREEFAVKIIDKEGHSRSRIFNEIEILHQCKTHPNIVQLLDFYEEDERFLLIFEKMNGGSLLDYLSKGGAFGERESSLVTRDIATALLFLHDKGIAHRDLKPANILCVNGHSVAPVKLCDFDLASAPWSRDDSSSSYSNFSADSIDLMSPVGSAEYMAPEVVNVFMGGMSAAAYDKRCDLWSLGVILYIMLCGYPPFVGNCGYPCGWEQGRSCTECQSMLMSAIQVDKLNFPSQQWDCVSAEAKDLVCGLLERDINKRITAQQVLDHDWLKIASAVASDPIPLDSAKLKRRSVHGGSKAAPFIELPFIAKYRNFNDGADGDCSISPDERQRLGTEDSGFGGDLVGGVVGLLMEAVEDDEGNQSMVTVNDGDDDHFFHIEDLKDGKLEDMCDDNDQFDLSDEESLFSSGYGLSLDLPNGNFKDIIDEESMPKSDNFVALNYERQKSQVNQDALCAMFDKMHSLRSPDPEGTGSSKKSSTSSNRTTILSDATNSANTNSWR